MRKLCHERSGGYAEHTESNRRKTEESVLLRRGAVEMADMAQRARKISRRKNSSEGLDERTDGKNRS